MRVIGESSRPSRAGSVAAGMSAPAPAWPAASSRPSRAGSVAAGRTGPGGGASSASRPAPHGRAPLQLRISAPAPAWPAASSPAPHRQGSVAARVAGRVAVADKVVPPLTGGLRCGFSYAGSCGPGPTSSRPSRAGSVAARRCSRSRRRAGPRRPAPHGRAPLRPEGRVRAWRTLRVVPPLTGGLRCGQQHDDGLGGSGGRPAPHGRAPLRRSRGDIRAPRPARSSRPSRAGSVAAPITAPPPTWLLRVVPPLTGGLRCGGYGGRVKRRRARRPAPHGRAPLRLVLRRGPEPGVAGRPAPHGRAPLRPRSPAGRQTGRVRSSRPSRAGSVAAGMPRIQGGPVQLVVPPLTGGLRCGPAIGLINSGDVPVVPPLTGGLRCGLLPLRGRPPGGGRPAPHGRAPSRR